MMLVLLAESTLPTATAAADTNAVDEEENPFLEAAKSLLQDSLAGGQGGQAGLGSVLLQSFMQSDGAKSGLGSIVSGLAGTKGSVDPQMIGQIVGMFAGGGDKSSTTGGSGGNDNGAPGMDWSSMIDLASGKLPRYTNTEFYPDQPLYRPEGVVPNRRKIYSMYRINDTAVEVSIGNVQ